MRKLIVGLIGALVVGAGAYLGAVHWAERTAAREVDARLERWRSAGATATRGRVSFDLWRRTVRVADVELRSPASSDERIVIAEVVASGIDASGGAARLDFVGLETSHLAPGLADIRVYQKAPRVTLTAFSERPAGRPKGASPIEAMRRWLEQVSAVSAASIEAPSLTVTLMPAASRSGTDLMGITEYVYSNVVLRDVADGRIGEAAVEKVEIRGSAGRLGVGFVGEIAGASVRGIDVGPVLAWLDPSQPHPDGFRRVYGQIAIGASTVQFDDGTGMGIDRILAEDIGLSPSRLPLDDLIFLMEVTRPGTPPATTGQLSMLVDKMAGLYEGLRLGRLELQGLRIAKPGVDLKVAGISLNGLDEGRLAELSIAGLGWQKSGLLSDGRTESPPPAGQPLGIGRATVKGFHIANLLRTASTQLALVGQRSVGQNPVLAMLGLLEGIEVRDAAVPDPAGGRTVQVEALDASWGRLVGTLPSEGRLSARLSSPIGPSAPDPFKRALAERGIATLAVSLDLGARWMEADESVVLSPMTAEIPHVVALSVKASAAKVAREMLSSDMRKVMGGAARVEAGPVEFTVRDLGLIEIAAGQLGKAKGGDAEAGRALLAEALAQRAAAATQTPELQAVLDALTRFVQGNGEALTLVLTPKGSVGLLQLIEDMRRDAIGTLLANFALEAKTGG